MPAKSAAQRRYLNAKFGHAWVKKHGFDNKGKLPARVGKKRAKKGSRPGPKVTHHPVHGTTQTYGTY